MKILLAEDERSLSRAIVKILESGGYTAEAVYDGADALAYLESGQYDAAVLDIMMPRMDGYEFTRTLRESGCELPILMVTAREKPEDNHLGFKIGTDDYMVKPVDEEEMVLRIAALLRRSRIVNEHRLTVGATTLDYDALSVATPEGEMTLPKKEFMLLFKLLSYPGKIFTRRQLMDEIWGMETETDERTVDVHVKRLRDHFEANPDFEISTVRGRGYKAVKKA